MPRKTTATRKPRKRRTRAQRADRYDLYQRSVQDPDSDVHLLRRIYKSHFGRFPDLLREDFCGTAYLACRWVAAHPESRAWGIDLDPEPLAWSRRNNVSKLRPSQAARLKLVRGNVLHARHEPVDVTVAFNFSFFVFDKRRDLLGYFRKARATLRKRGLFVLDAYGGADAQRCQEEIREHDDFDYVWDQDRFDPIGHSVTNYIHFAFPDRSRLQRAFSYHWRLWSIPELRELLEEAGFRKVEVFWEGTERKTGEGNGIFTRRSSALDDPAWIAYIAAVR